jgi:sialate O-acetylesterase
MKKIYALSLFTLFILSAHAAVRLPAIIGSHMVLQQKAEVTIWGWADPGEKITLKASWDTATYSTTGNGHAKWSLKLRTPAAGGPHTISIKGTNSIVLEDVLIGEVWLASGQSNMEWSMGWGLPYEKEIAAATNKSIRFFHVPKTTAEFPQEDVAARWVVCSPEAAKGFSATAYFFGSSLADSLKIPVGLIASSWGGTPAEAWTPVEVVEKDSVLKKAATRLNPSGGWPVAPALAYNAMIHPLSTFNIAGAIWYQGESNVGTASTYRHLFTSMITSWRAQWRKDFPFYFVQIAPFAGYGNNSSSAFLREAQTQSLTLPGTGMITTSDLVDNINDIHPKMKKEVGQRLANLALAQTYNRTGIAHKSPTFKEKTVLKDRITIDFNDVPTGLVSRGGAPTGFYIAGSDRIFYPATAKIVGKTVVVRSPEVKNPVEVRFGFTNSSMPNLFTREGLPVNLFRTDDWHVDITEKNR